MLYLYIYASISTPNIHFTLTSHLATGDSRKSKKDLTDAAARAAAAAVQPSLPEEELGAAWMSWLRRMVCWIGKSHGKVWESPSEMLITMGKHGKTLTWEITWGNMDNHG